MPRTRLERASDDNWSVEDEHPKKPGVAGIPVDDAVLKSYKNLMGVMRGPQGIPGLIPPAGMNGPGDPREWDSLYLGGTPVPPMRSHQSLADMAHEFIAHQHPSHSQHPALHSRVAFDEFAGIIIYGETEYLERRYVIRGIWYGNGSNPVGSHQVLNIEQLMSAPDELAVRLIHQGFDQVFLQMYSRLRDSLQSQLR